MMAAGERDLQLVERIRQGDTYVFGELMAPYRRKLFLHVLRIVKHHGDADDVVQDTMIRAYRGLKNFRGEACFYTWLCRIAINSALAFIAQRKRLQAGACFAELEQGHASFEASACDDPEQIMFGQQMLATVGAALESMLPEYKTAILMRELDGLSYDEIAAAMVCPVGTVKSRISSARSAIASKLKLAGFMSAST